MSSLVSKKLESRELAAADLTVAGHPGLEVFAIKL
jgi:hypothetical protein